MRHVIGWRVPIVRQLARKAIFPIAKSRPDFLIIGAQKAGTTSLHKYLSAHPQIADSDRPKELHFFNLYYDRGIDWYLSHFPYRFQKGDQLQFEATPDYLHRPHAAGRIRQDLGDIKLIVVLRNPAERAYSAWKMWHSFSGHPEKRKKADPRSFERAISDELEAEHSEDNRPYYYVDIGKYANHIEKYQGVFDRRNILILDHGEMERDLYSFLNRICRFLDIEPYGREVADALAGKKYWASPKKTMTIEESQVIDKLREYYAPYNEKLKHITDRNFSW